MRIRYEGVNNFFDKTSKFSKFEIFLKKDKIIGRTSLDKSAVYQLNFTNYGLQNNRAKIFTTTPLLRAFYNFQNVDRGGGR